jgi:hypothetical protein
VLVDAPEDTDVLLKEKWRSATAVAVLIGLILGFLGWTLPTYGGSLVVPTLIVFGVGALVVLGSLALAFFWRRRSSLWLFSAIAAVFTVFASIWTPVLSLPASLAWDPGATQHAQLIIAGLRQGAVHGVAPLRPCAIVNHGSIGTLHAPYRQCAIYTNQGHFVTFTPADNRTRGLSYTDVGAATFLDACSRHLVGRWRMFVGDNSSGNCPVGYQFHGGA